MKLIKLAAPAVVNTNPLGTGAGELRHPIEGQLPVCDDEAKRLSDNKLLDGEPEALPEPDTDGDENGDGLEDMLVADLGILATKEGTPLHGATKKTEIIAAIRKHREPAA